jgi:hypothetical protein
MAPWGSLTSKTQVDGLLKEKVRKILDTTLNVSGRCHFYPAVPLKNPIGLCYRSEFRQVCSIRNYCHLL